MADNTGIEWTDATWTDERGRLRSYRRIDSTRPGQQVRRQKAAEGLSYCRGCRDWLPTADVRDGVCRPHRAEEYRAQYAANPQVIRQRVHARKRAIDPVPLAGIEYLTEQFGGKCAYCPAAATSWDHVIAVAKGGRTEPGNIVPACQPCNSSKKDSDVWTWLASTGRTPHPTFFDVTFLVEVA